MFKKSMPSVKIGGFASCGMLTPEHYDYFIHFLEYIKARGLPLDFYSWHTYTSNLLDLRQNALIARTTLDRFGYTRTESILDEWNYLVKRPDVWGDLFAEGGAQARKEVFLETSGITGAAFTSAALIEMCDLPIDIATFYDGQPVNIFCTIFDRFGFPTKQYHAFEAFHWLVSCGERVGLAADLPGIYAIAAGSSEKLGILAANWGGETDWYPYEIIGLDPDLTYRYTLYLLDEYRALELVMDDTGKPVTLPHGLYLHHHSVAFVQYTAVHEPVS